MRLQQSRPNAAALLNTNRVNESLNSALGEDSSLKKIEMTNKIYFNILQMLPEPILMTTLEQTICFSNAAARNLLDPNGDDLRGLPLSHFIDNREKLNQWAQKCERSAIFVSESFHLTTKEKAKSATMELSLIHI
jgi:nitrogen-specific signal transduction histidine kinase